jgi:hypothetical protein
LPASPSRLTSIKPGSTVPEPPSKVPRLRLPIRLPTASKPLLSW